MAKVLTFEIPESEYNDLKSFIKDYSAEIHKSLEAMKQDQIEIDRLRKESEKKIRVVLPALWNIKPIVCFKYC